MSAELQLTFGYANSSSTDKFAFDIEDSIAAASGTIKSNIQAVNASLSAGTDGGLSDFFVAEDFDGVGGVFNRISAAAIVSKTETIIYPANGGN